MLVFSWAWPLCDQHYHTYLIFESSPSIRAAQKLRSLLPQANNLFFKNQNVLVWCSKNMMKYVLPYLVHYLCNISLPPGFYCSEICRTSAQFMLQMLPCMLRSDSMLLVSLWDAEVSKLNLSLNDIASKVSSTQLPSHVKQNTAASVHSPLKTTQHLMMAKCLIVILLCAFL